MYVITITKWKRKLVALLVIAALFIGLGFGIDWFLSPEDSNVNAPAEQNLQQDVLNQPVQVQGEQAEDEKDVQPQEPPAESK